MDVTPLLRRVVEVARNLLPVAFLADTAHSLYTVHCLARDRLRVSMEHRLECGRECRAQVLVLGSPYPRPYPTPSPTRAPQELQQEEQEALVSEVVGTLRQAAQRCGTGHDRPFWPDALNLRLGLALADAGDKASAASALPDGQDATCPVPNDSLFEALGLLPPSAPDAAAAQGHHSHPAESGAHAPRAPPAAAGWQAPPELSWTGGGGAAGQGGRVQVTLFTLQDAWDHCAALAEGEPGGGGGGGSGSAAPRHWTPAAVKARLAQWAAGAASAAQDSIQSRLPSSELLLVKPSVVGQRSAEWLGIRRPPSKEGA